MQERIMVIEDDTGLRQMLSGFLGSRGYEVVPVPTGREGLRMAYQKHPSLVLLDITLPDLDGWQTCGRLREMSDVPIIVVSGRVADEDVLTAFRLGADDYVRKPFNLQELEERVRAVLRRSSDCSSENVAFDDGYLRIDLGRQQVWRKGEAIRLSPTEFRLLSYLMKHTGSVVERTELLRQVWGPSYRDATSCLTLYISYLRNKLETDPSTPKYIHTKWGVGYSFTPENGHPGIN